MELGLNDKVVLITGGAMGIGQATAVAFAREGAHLALLDRDESALQETKKLLEDQGVRVETTVADLSTEAGCSEGVREALEVFDGRVDVLVNNVGAGFVRTFDDLSDQDWHDTLALNFMSYVRTIRAVLPGMRAAKSGCIVNNGSDLARQPEANPIDYAVSKAAVLALTKGLARSEGPDIRINAVAPGPIWTPFWTKPGGFAETLGEVHGMPPQEAVEYEMSLRQLPLGRLGRPEEVASVIVFLASAQASFVTSSVWGIDGGSIRSLT